MLYLIMCWQKFLMKKCAYQDVVARCADAVEVWISSGIEQAMNQYNSSGNDD